MQSLRKAIITPTVVVALLSVLAVRSANADSIPIINLDPTAVHSGFDETHIDGMVGWEFSLLQTVTEVGWYDAGQDGGISRWDSGARAVSSWDRPVPAS
jgi:ABC-type taurine transport system substrate-binding protein